MAELVPGLLSSEDYAGPGLQRSGKPSTHCRGNNPDSNAVLSTDENISSSISGLLAQVQDINLDFWLQGLGWARLQLSLLP